MIPRAFLPYWDEAKAYIAFLRGKEPGPTLPIPPLFPVTAEDREALLEARALIESGRERFICYCPAVAKRGCLKLKILRQLQPMASVAGWVLSNGRADSLISPRQPAWPGSTPCWLRRIPMPKFHLFHNWSPWLDYTRKLPTRPISRSLMLMPATEHRQQRRCVICGKAQDRLVRTDVQEAS